MSTTFSLNCPTCNYRIRASSEHIGRTGRCPNCKSLVEIRAAGDQAVETTRGSQEKQTLKPATTDAPTWLTGLIGVVVTLLLYLLLFMPLKNFEFGKKFLERGPVMYFETLFFSWGCAILVLKYLAVKRQLSYAELELQLIPLEIGLQITQTNVDQFLNHLARQPTSQRSSILGRRIAGALEHFRSRNNVSEVQSYLSTQGGIDASAVDSGYTMLKAFIWAIPILGFIGTVIGLSQAVVGLQAASGSADMTAALQQAMGQVTAGLATAFDTTLVALIMAILLLFPMESLRRTEYSMLDRIEQFANESLLRRLADNDSSSNVEEMPQVVRHALESAFQQHQKWLVQWQTQVAQLGQVIGGEFESTVLRVKDKLEQDEGSRITKWQELSKMVQELFQRTCESTVGWHKSEQRVESQAQALAAAADRLDQGLNVTLQRLAQIEIPTVPKESSSQDLGAQLQRLEEQLSRLATAIEHIPSAADSQSLLSVGAVPTLEPDGDTPKKRGFSFFGRRRL